MNAGTTGDNGYRDGVVSVVIPTYGRNETLPRAIRSVLHQTYDDIELIVVDDGSPTPVTETLPDMSFDQLDSTTFIRHNDNRGANVARNSGIRSATGEYLAFLDDDDRWRESKISRQVDAFETAGPDVGVVYTGVRATGPSGTTTNTPTAEGNVIKYLLTGGAFGQFSSVMVRHDATEKAGLPDERLPAWQDRDWFFRLAREYHFKSIPEPLTIRETKRSDSITRNFERKRDVAYPIFMEKHYPFARDYGLYYRRMFLASMRKILGRSAVGAGEYRQARRYFILSFLANPLYRPVYLHLIASLGGERTYEFASYMRKKILAFRS